MGKDIYATEKVEAERNALLQHVLMSGACPPSIRGKKAWCRTRRGDDGSGSSDDLCDRSRVECWREWLGCMSEEKKEAPKRIGSKCTNNSDALHVELAAASARAEKAEAEVQRLQSRIPTPDQETLLLLERQRAYAGKEWLFPHELEELSQINRQLESHGFRFYHQDEEFSRYLRLRSNAMRDKFRTNDPEALACYMISMTDEEREELAKRLIRELVEANPEGGAA